MSEDEEYEAAKDKFFVLLAILIVELVIIGVYLCG
jgi:hypothetical protein